MADIAKLSVGREGYYTRELASDHEQYLSGHGESPGRWYGASSSSLGLQADGVTVAPARRVPDLLCALPPILGPERVAWLADRARLRFRAAA